MAWRIKCPPSRPSIGESAGGGGSSSLGGRVSPGMEKDAAARGGGGVWPGGLRPRPPNKKPGPEALPRPRLFRALTAAAPLRRPRRGPLSAGNIPKGGYIGLTAITGGRLSGRPPMKHMGLGELRVSDRDGMEGFLLDVLA